MKDLKLKIIAEGFDKASKPFRNIVKTSSRLQKSLGKTAKELKALDATQKRLKGFATLKRQSGQTSIELGKAQRQAQKLALAFRNADAPTMKMARATKAAAKQVKQLKQRQTAQRMELQTSRTAFSQAGIAVRRMGQEQGKVARKIADTNRRLEQQQRSLRRSTQLQNRMTRASARYRRTLQTQANVSFVGAAGVAGGGLALRGIAGALAPGTSFDEQMSAVGGIRRIDKTSEAFASLRAQALELGSTTQFSASEAAGGMEFLARAGFQVSDILSSMPGLLDVAKAGRTELTETADITSNILSAFKLDASQMGMLGDTLVGTFTRSNVDLRQLGETMSFVANNANQVGASVQEIAALAGMLGNVGIQGSRAGTALDSIISRLSAPPSDTLKALDRLDIDPTDDFGNLRPAAAILADVATATETMGNAARLGFFKAIAGKRAAGAFAETVGRAGAGELTRFIEVLNNVDGESRALALAMGDNAAGDLKGLTSAWEGLNIAIGDTQTSHLRATIQGITGIVRSTTDWVRENPRLAGTIFTVVTGIATLWTVIGGLALVVAGIVGPFAIVSFALTAVGLKGLALIPIIKGIGTALFVLGKLFLANPIGLAITGIAVAAFLIWKYWGPISAFFVGLWSGIKETFQGGIGSITAAIINWSPLGLFYKAFAGVLSWFGVELPATFTGFGAAIVGGLVSGITGAFQSLMGAMSFLGEAMGEQFKDLLGISSPSKVFMKFGGFVTEGLALGVRGGQGRAVEAVSRLGRALPRAVAAGALSASIATVPAYAGPSARNVQGGDNVEIHIHAPAGVDAQEIARMVRLELDARDRERAATSRSTLHD